MRGTYQLSVFMPDRHRLGALKNALVKYDVQFVHGSAEAEIIEQYDERDGLLLTFIDWAPATVVAAKGRKSERIELPEVVMEMLEEVASAVHNGFEVGVFVPEGTYHQRAQVDLHRLREQLAVGCRYVVNP